MVVLIYKKRYLCLFFHIFECALHVNNLPHIRKALKDQLYSKVCRIYHFLFDCEVENTLFKNENSDG